MTEIGPILIIVKLNLKIWTFGPLAMDF